MKLGDTNDDVDEPPFRTPLPPDDRLWRHPSELEEQQAAARQPRRSLFARLRRAEPPS